MKSFGIRTMAKPGISLTKDQKDKILELVKEGKLLDAQKEILHKLKEELDDPNKEKES